MYFKKLEIVGFKSFFNKTTLHFEPGITAVVGPNGCGKSNIFDSIRWVLGEQSVKSLRGSEMQDVIFNGTDFKEPLSMAEVSLVFDNNDKFFNVDHQEIIITRRIFRSGESEYLLNKNIVRLKDILEILMGTGVGAESYSLVAQGKIDLILSSRPEDRRLVFDEAAGITKYKTQKKEALRKLEETEQNLLRVNDIINEVKRQIGSLERQANKARRYKEVFEELKLKEINLAILERQSFLCQKEEIIKGLGELQAKEGELLSIIKDQESRISDRQTEIKSLEEGIMGIKNEILNLENLMIRNREHISFNKERIKELDDNREYLEAQIEQAKGKLFADEEKLSKVRQEYAGINKNIEEKACLLKENEIQLDNLTCAIKTALETISGAKNNILSLVTKITNVKNEINDLMARQQTHLARKKRLELEKAKVNEELFVIEGNLKGITQELENLKKIFEESSLKITNIKDEAEDEGLFLSKINSQIEDLEKNRLTLQSHREFIEKLKTKYDDIGESMNAVVYLDKLPAENITGLVLKINNFQQDKLKVSGEAKPIDLDTQKISQRIEDIQYQISSLVTNKTIKEEHIKQLRNTIQGLEEDLHNQEIVLSNKKTAYQGIEEQFNKIKEEQGLINIELQDVDKELEVLSTATFELNSSLSNLGIEQKQQEDSIVTQQNNITNNNDLKEKALVIIAQTKAEIEALNKRIISDEAMLKILESTYQQDRDSLINLEKQINDALEKKDLLILEIKDCENKVAEAIQVQESSKFMLKETEIRHQAAISSINDVVKKIESDRTGLDALKNNLYELQMQNKDIDFKFIGTKERILQAYKIDLDSINDFAKIVDEGFLRDEIQKLKEKLDSYGTVNLVAIEEYDELKKRYDFLIQQQTDLVTAKDALHEAIQKINRTTRKMFLDTFQQVRQEFRNYFRMLFNGGDAQVFLIDEQDPLESGIEIICRPPGKKLQNVLLLSGGEKSLSAIALIFAIFKVKPSPFCILDEIDAALDEANVDRFGRVLQEFAKISQFIVITHNKRTIANADVMYGITMEESGVSKIVSVKFAQNNPSKSVEEPVAEADPV